MALYKDTQNKLYAIDSTEYEYLLPTDCIAITQEEADILTADAPLTTKQIALNSIQALESSVTPRRIREAVLGTDIGWLANVNTQIATLRLVK